MTAYVVYAGSTSSSLLVVSYQIRLARVEAVGLSTGSPTLTVTRYTGGSVSGGSLVTPAPMRSGAPASACVARSAPSTPSGTAVIIFSTIGTVWEPTFDVLMSPGTIIYVSANSVVTLYYEEQRQLSWSY